MNSIKHISPLTLSLITTHICTSSCPNCCFNCSPTPLNKNKMTCDEMKKYIIQSLNAYPSIKMVIFTGGECTLLKDDLLDAIQFASMHNLTTRIVTNAHWAKTDESAINVINALIESGLTEINFSTGDEHIKFVPLEQVIRAIKLCAKHPSFTNVVVNIENNPGNKTCKKIYHIVQSYINLTR